MTTTNPTDDGRTDTTSKQTRLTDGGLIECEHPAPKISQIITPAGDDPLTTCIECDDTAPFDTITCTCGADLIESGDLIHQIAPDAGAREPHPSTHPVPDVRCSKCGESANTAWGVQVALAVYSARDEPLPGEDDTNDDDREDGTDDNHHLDAIRVERDELIHAYQQSITTAPPQKSVFAELDTGATKLRYEYDMHGWAEIDPQAFIADDPTGMHALIDEHGLADDAVDTWADAIKLRDEIPPRYSPTGESLPVEYTSTDDTTDDDRDIVTDGGRRVEEQAPPECGECSEPAVTRQHGKPVCSDHLIDEQYTTDDTDDQDQDSPRYRNNQPPRDLPRDDWDTPQQRR